MAGPSSFRVDPALSQWDQYMKNRWKYFRWTPRVAVIATMYGIVVPSAMGYLFYRTDGKYDFRGKLRGDTIKEW